MPNATLLNFAGGETAPKSRGRFDTSFYNSSCRKMVNFIADVSGPARYRSGFRFLSETRDGGVARLIPFQFRDESFFMLEFTSGKMRAYDANGDIIKVDTTTITGVTAADPCVITVDDAADLDDGDTIILTDVAGMTELNGRQFKLANNDGDTFELTDPITGDDIDSSGYAAYTSGGDVFLVTEIATPYLEADLPYLMWAHQGEEMYLDHYSYYPKKLSYESGVFSIADYVRTSDPLSVGPALTVGEYYRTGVYGPKVFVNDVVLITDGTPMSGANYILAGCEEVAAINGKTVKLVSFDPSYPYYFFLFDTATDTYIQTAGGASATIIAGGTATPTEEHFVAPAFYESRMVHAGTDLRPRTLFISRSPDGDGASRLDDFTGGTDADHALFFSLAPTSNTVDYITWAGGTSRYLLIGTFGGVFRVTGAGTDEPLAPDSINVKQMDTFGCEPTMPVLAGNQAYFIQRGGVTLRSIQYDTTVDDFATVDMCLNAEQVTWSPLKSAVLQRGRPDMIWCVREDGQLAAMTVHNGERVAGWHRHKIGGTGAKVLDAAVQPRTDNTDRIWVVTERTIDGNTHRFVEVMADEVPFPDVEDFYSGESNAAADEETFYDAVYRLQERYVNLDGYASYDGSDAGDAAAATLTPGATTGEDVTFTASASVFTAADVGKELWKKPDPVTGLGAGRATITAYTSATEVTADIDATFDSTDAIAAGDWYLAADEISGLWHLEGERVAVVADGAVYSDGRTSEYPTVTVSSGAITLTRNAAVVHVGLPYEGLLITHNLEMGGVTGPAQDKPRNIARIAIRFMDTLGVDYGTDLYNMESVVHNSNKYKTDRPTPVFSGVKIVHNSDDWIPGNGEKKIVIAQRLPLPCIVQFINIYYETGDEG